MGLDIATILAISSIASTVGGTGLSVYTGQQEAKAQEAAARANAKSMGETAKAREAEDNENTYRAQRDARRQIAGLRTRMAGSGTQLNDGSNQDILGNASLRLETSINEQSRAAQMDARAMRNNAALTTWQGGQASAAAGMQSVGTVLSGFGQVAKNTYNFRQQGTLKNDRNRNYQPSPR